MFQSPADVASVLCTDLGVLLGLLLMARVLDRTSVKARILYGATAASFIICYAVWRLTNTLPRVEPSIDVIWPYLFFVFEMVAICYTLMSIVILFRFKDRSIEADEAEEELHVSGRWPAVDVFICTYNEPLDVLERSIIPALAIDYPEVTIWVCDDTRRDWLKAYCESVGANYVTRPDNVGAKAGNLNNALSHTSRSTNAPLILVLDADFAVVPHILRRTVGLFKNELAGVVQTPQFFFNADPIQHNLMASEAWVDDQRIFFDIFQPAKDAWGCAFCVGTSFLVRRDLVTNLGGFPQDAICEDINLTYTLMRSGYKTHWLNERLSSGLSAEGLPEYITQRTRWCLGTIQVALLKNGPFRGTGYTLAERIHYLHGVLNWLCKPFIVLMLVAPSIYWCFDMPAFYADYLSFLRYGLPALLALWIYSGWISGQRTLPLFMEVTHIMTALAVSVTLVSAAIRPFGRPFKVTDKGGDRSTSVLRMRMAAAFLAITVSSGASIVWSFISPYAATEVSSIDFFNLLWAGVAMLFTFVAFLVCFERPRSAELFEIAEAGRIRDDGLPATCTIDALGLTSALIGGLPETFMSSMNADRCEVWTAATGWMKAAPIGARQKGLLFEIHPNKDQRHSLIRRLYTTAADPIARTASLPLALRSLYNRCFRTT